jgi:hypothetical protein
LDVRGRKWRETAQDCIHYQGDQIKGDEMGGHVACMEEMRNMYKILVGNLEEKRLVGRPRRRWKDNIRMDHK